MLACDMGIEYWLQGNDQKRHVQSIWLFEPDNFVWRVFEDGIALPAGPNGHCWQEQRYKKVPPPPGVDRPLDWLESVIGAMVALRKKVRKRD